MSRQDFCIAEYNCEFVESFSQRLRRLRVPLLRVGLASIYFDRFPSKSGRMKLTLKVTVQLTASLDKGPQPTDSRKELSLGPGEEEQCCAHCTYHTGLLRPSTDSQQRGIQKHIRHITSIFSRGGARERRRQVKPYEFSKIDTSIAGQEIRYHRVSELTGCDLPILPKSSVGDRYPADHKSSLSISEMSPDRPPVELETPTAERDLISPYYFPIARASSETFAQRDCASLGYNTLVNHLHELPGDDPSTFFNAVNPDGIAEMSTWRQTAIQDADALNVMHSDSLLDDSELAHEACIGDSHHSFAAGYAVAQPAMPAVPGFLSPQALSQKSSPASPDTPANGISLSGYQYTVSGPVQIQDANLYRCDEPQRPFSHSSTASIPGPSLYGSDVSQVLSVPGLDLHSFDKALFVDFTQTDVDEGPTYWSGELDSPFRPCPQQEEDLSGGSLAPGASSQVFNTIDGEEKLLSLPQIQPSLMNETFVSSCLPTRTRLSLQELQKLQARTGTWQMVEDSVWAACDRSISDPELEKAEHGSQNYATVNPRTSSPSMNDPRYFKVSKSEKISTFRKTYCPVNCNHCGREFTGHYAKGNMKRHFNQKHGNGVGKVHKCRMCDKVFLRGDAKVNHERSVHR